MDFSALIIAPLAAVITFIWMSVSVLIRPRSKDRSFLPAFCGALISNLLLDQPWYYVSQSAFFSGVTRLLILTSFGFAIGALVVLILVKTIRAARDYFWPRA